MENEIYTCIQHPISKRTICGNVAAYFRSSPNLCSYWRLVLILVTPLALLPCLSCRPEEGENIGKVVYVVLIMAVFWVTEVVPLPVTALIPVLAFPLLGVTKAADVAKQYITVSSGVVKIIYVLLNLLS